MMWVQHTKYPKSEQQKPNIPKALNTMNEFCDYLNDESYLYFPFRKIERDKMRKYFKQKHKFQQCE